MIKNRFISRYSLISTLLLLVFFFNSFSPALAEVPTQTKAVTSANFQMGTDATVMIEQLARPGGQQVARDIASLGGGWVRLEFQATDPTNLKRYDRAISRLQFAGV